MREVLRTISQFHANGVVIRDVKPENFLFATDDKESHLKAIDFGIAQFCGCVCAMPRAVFCRACRLPCRAAACNRPPPSPGPSHLRACASSVPPFAVVCHTSPEHGRLWRHALHQGCAAAAACRFRLLAIMVRAQPGRRLP